MSWFAKGPPSSDEKRTIGEGVFRRCDECAETRAADEFVANYEVCPACGMHYPLVAEGWRNLLIDEGSWKELDTGLLASDRLSFRDSKAYPDRLRAARKAVGTEDAIQVGRATLDGRPIQFGAFVFQFLGGSMGAVVGEKITRMFERGTELKEPVILVTASGGARMQEGVLSLMQMAKTVAALGRLRDAGVPFISVLLNPTTGGVAASFALLGDVNLAEPKALIGFAGPRVIENTIRQTLPEGFQRSEFLLKHGMIDRIVDRKDMRQTISLLLFHLLG